MLSAHPHCVFDVICLLLLLPLSGRDIAKTTAVATSIIAECGGGDAAARVHVIALDLSDLASVRACVEQFRATGLPLHVLLNNAGCMAVQEREETKGRIVVQFEPADMCRWLASTD